MTTEKKPGKVFALIPEVMKSIGAVGKDGFNQNQKYPFRKIDTLLGKLQPALIEHGLLLIPRVLSSELSRPKSVHILLMVEYTVLAIEDGSSFVVVVAGEGADSLDKAANKAMTAAFKLLCFQLFCIPTDAADDPETTRPPDATPPPAKPALSAAPGTATSDQVKAILDHVEAKGVKMEPVFKWAEGQFSKAGLRDAKMGQVADLSEQQAAITMEKWGIKPCSK